MASASLSHSPIPSLKCHKLQLLSVSRINIFPFQHKPVIQKTESLLSSRTFLYPGRPKISVTRVSCDDFLGKIEKDESLPLISEEKTVKFLLGVLLWASVSLGLHALLPGDAGAAAIDSIRGSGFGIKVANALRASGWPDEAVVFALATLPVIELRGAIPVGYWLQLNPVLLTILSVLGNMVPVPLIILYMKKLVGASKFVDMLFEGAKQKAGPVKEFQWLGLMLFVAVPFPGTGAWTGAFIASVLDMPFFSAVSANLVGVVVAALLVNLLVNIGLKYAVVTAVVLFLISTFMWSVLRRLKKSLPLSDDAK